VQNSIILAREIYVYLALDFGGIIMKEDHKSTYKCFVKYVLFVTITNMATILNFEMISAELKAGSSWVSVEQVMEISSNGSANFIIISLYFTSPLYFTKC
jgi:hypothetical protein